MFCAHPRLLMQMDQQHFKATVLPLKARLFRTAWYMLKSTELAEDILQDVMVKLWNKRAELTEKRNIEAFCVTVTKNTCLDWLKAKKNQAHEDVSTYAFTCGELTPEEAVERKESRNVMLSLIDRLPTKQRELILLREIEGYSYQEISEMSGTEINTIRVTLSRARNSLKTLYEKEVKHEV